MMSAVRMDAISTSRLFVVPLYDDGTTSDSLTRISSHMAMESGRVCILIGACPFTPSSRPMVDYGFSHRISAHLDAVGVVDQAVQDAIAMVKVAICSCQRVAGEWDWTRRLLQP